MSRKSKTMAVIVYLLLLLCLLIPTIASAQEKSNWNHQLISTKAARGHIAIAVDSNNLPHIAYMAYENGNYHNPIDVMYASFNGSEWSTQVVKQGKGTIDLALDSNNNPHIIFNDYPIGASLMYAEWNENNWTFQKVDNNGRSGSLKLDSENNPHIAYNGPNNDLKYATLTGSNWNIQTVDSSRYELLEYQTSLCFDKNDTPHILYSFSTGQTSNSISTIKYAYLQPNGWNIQTVASNVDMGYGNLALDPAGNPHFTYSKGHPQSTSNHVTITHRFFNGSVWDSDVIGNNIMSLSFGSGYLTIEANGIMYANYLTYDSNINGYLQLAKFTNGRWNTQTIVNGSAIGAYAVAIDSHGNLHVIYNGPNPESSRYSYLYYITNNKSTVSQSVPFQTIMLTALAIAIVLTIFTVAGILLFRRHRKATNLKQ